MKNEHKHLLARLLVSAFLILGLGLWTSHFVVNAANWDIGGTNRNNENFLSGDFWDNGPTSGDIIKALYGSGGEGTAYTQNWSGYTFGSCLSGGMNVITTGVLPTTLASNTIYVIDSGTYTITTGITMNTCSALISSGIVTLSGNVGGSGTIFASEKNNFIIEKISVAGNDNGIYIASGTNFSLNEISLSYNANGLDLKNSYYGMMRNIETHDIGMYGIYFENSNTNMITGCIIASQGPGIYLNTSNNNTINNSYHTDWETSIWIVNASGTTINNFSGQGYIVEANTTGLFQYTTYDINTQTNNYIYLDSDNNATLTGNNITTGTTFITYFDRLYLNNFSLVGSTGLTVSGATWDGKLYTPTPITAGTKKANLGETGTTLFSQIYDTIEVVSGNTYLTMNGGTGIIDFIIGSGTSGQYLSILKSVDGNDWTANTLQTGCVLDENKKCNFTTNGTLKLFAFGTPGLFFTGTTQSGVNVTSGGYYNTGVRITYTGESISGATLSGVSYSSGTLITGNGTYVFLLSNIRGNSTGMLFTIDTIAPTLNGVTYGTYYNSNVIIAGSDNTSFSGFQLNGTWYAGTSLTVTGEGNRTLTGYDRAGNTTGTVFTIDKTKPTFSGARNGAYYSGNVTVTGNDNLSFNTFLLNGVVYPGNALTITGEGTRHLTGSDLAGNTTGITFIIDKTAPIITGATNGNYYTNNVTIIGSDTFWSGFTLDGVWYTGTSLTVTGENSWYVLGYDYAGNTSTGIYFTIDKTAPTFTGVINGAYYNDDVTITRDDNIDFSGFLLSGTWYSSSSITLTDDDEGIRVFTGYDRAGNTTGGRFIIDSTTPSVTAISPTSGLLISGTNAITFVRSGTDTNMSGYTLYITGTEIFSGTTSGNSLLTNLMNGSYTRYVRAYDRAGNSAVSQTFPLIIAAPYSGYAVLTGPTLYIGGQWFTKDVASVYIRANTSVNYMATGSFSHLITGTATPWAFIYPVMTGSDGPKDILVRLTNSLPQTIDSPLVVYLDTTVPAPTLTSPTNGGSVVGTFNLTWSPVIDNIVGLSGYQYFVSPTNLFYTILASGFTTSTSTTISGLNLGLSGTYYWQVKSVDKLGNVGTSAVQSFYYSGGVTDTTPNTFSFTHITDARIDRTYTSTTATITGLSENTPVLASVNRGVLYISGTMVGTTGYIQNGWTVKIELISSNDYDTTVTSTLSIGGVSANFSVTTMEEDDDENDDENIETDLSNTEKLQILAVFQTLRDLYAGDKEEEFFNTLMVMLDNKIADFDENDEEYDALKYLYDLVEQYYDNGSFGDNVDTATWIKDGVYTAPNGKRYKITYDSSKQRFTSTNFVVPKYFPTLDTLKYIIDINNPVGSAYANSKTILARWKNAAIDGTRQTSPYTAPNHKVFYFFKSINDRYSSYTFTTERYFDSLDAAKEFIYNSNKR